MKYEGSCHCGQVKFQTDLRPMLIHQCNCTSCRKFTGSVRVACNYLSDEVEWSGAVSEYVFQGGSGGNIYTQCCPNCHSFAYATFDYLEGVTSIPLGMFNDPHGLMPSLEIWTDSKLSWLQDDGCIKNSVPDSGTKERLIELLESLENR